MSDDEVRVVRDGEGQPTDIECANCGEAYYLDGDDRYCPVCFYAPEKRPSTTHDDEWEQFWAERRRLMNNPNEDGRPYCVGGFTRPYMEDDGIY